jgi:cobyrinic acid a,c-diamide synthase
MTGKPQGHGYVMAKVENENPFFAPGTVLRGHEFHNSRLVEVRRTLFNGSDSSDDQSRLSDQNSKGRCDALTAYHLSRGNGIGENRDGIIYRNLLASYTHLHSGGAPDWATGLVRRAREYRETRQGVKS